MLVLTIRTEKPEAELALYNDTTLVNTTQWHAHRALASTIHTKIHELLAASKLKLSDIGGIVFYAGPGSFTGLRIGATLANTLADSLEIPVTTASGDKWQERGIDNLEATESHSLVVPDYGSQAHTTTPKK